MPDIPEGTGRGASEGPSGMFDIPGGGIMGRRGDGGGWKGVRMKQATRRWHNRAFQVVSFMGNITFGRSGGTTLEEPWNERPQLPWRRQNVGQNNSNKRMDEIVDQRTLSRKGLRA